MFKPMKIKDLVIKNPIIQGGMGLGISWDNLAGNVAKNGALGVISTVGTGYYKNGEFANYLANRPKQTEHFYSRESLKNIISSARKICGNAPLAANVLYASNDYGRIVKDACELGFDAIITGAGLPTGMPEWTKGYEHVALIPIVSSAKALKIICKRWKQRYDRLPDAVIVEGPKSGGHQGFTYEQCIMDEYQLENILPGVVEEAKNWGSMPVIAAGGIWDKNDIQSVMDLGASGVQMGTRFIGTHECDANDNFKEVLLNAEEKDIKLVKSPVGYPARAIESNLLDLVEKREGPKIKCISNCVSPCKSGVEAKIVGYCIADRLADAYNGKKESGLFFSGSNGYRLKKLVSVKELIKELVD